jgi:hypothetical protein
MTAIIMRDEKISTTVNVSCTRFNHSTLSRIENTTLPSTLKICKAISESFSTLLYRYYMLKYSYIIIIVKRYVLSYYIR